jgi:hypothetical protein
LYTETTEDFTLNQGICLNSRVPEEVVHQLTTNLYTAETAECNKEMCLSMFHEFTEGSQ